MAHYAKIDSSSEVVQVIKIENSEIINSDGIINPWEGVFILQQGEKNIGENISQWVQTSYKGSIRKNYAGLGYRYDEDLDAFIPPKPFTSWTLDEDTCQWEAPTPMPDDGKEYMWDEEIQDWSLLEEQEIINE